MNDYMVQVAAIAKAVPGVPVQLIWSREDDIRRDYYRPGGWHSFEAVLGAYGGVDDFNRDFVAFRVCKGSTRDAGVHGAVPPVGPIQIPHFQPTKVADRGAYR